MVYKSISKYGMVGEDVKDLNELIKRCPREYIALNEDSTILGLVNDKDEMVYITPNIENGCADVVIGAAAKTEDRCLYLISRMQDIMDITDVDEALLTEDVKNSMKFLNYDANQTPDEIQAPSALIAFGNISEDIDIEKKFNNCPHGYNRIEIDSPNIFAAFKENPKGHMASHFHIFLIIYLIILCQLQDLTGKNVAL